ncbi:MAG: N utilization substance protein B [Gammaproteobacteria bacterium]|jgi:N utilization substance protein B
MSVSSNKKSSINARVRARRSVVQALYQWGMSEKSMLDIIREFENDRSELNKADIDYFREILKGVEEHLEELDGQLTPLLDRPVVKLDPVENAILHLGMYELLYHPELPWRVVLNESIELAKMFGAEQSHKYVNGILDKAAHKIRKEEFSRTET